MEIPCVLFVDCHEKMCENILKDLIKLENKKFEKTSFNSFSLNKWNLETKYYTANINLCLLKDLRKLEQTIKYCNNKLEGIILSFDCENDGSLERVKAICTSIEDNYPLKILTCSSLKHKSHKHMVLEWCIGNEFELVELDVDAKEDDEEDEEEDELITEKKGIERILEVIKCNQWSNLVLKEKKRKKLDVKESDKTNEDTNINEYTNINGYTNRIDKNSDNSLEDHSTNGSEKSNEKELNNQENNCFQERKENNSEDRSTNNDELEQLFKSIPSLKDKADRLGFEERKAYAEEVVMKLWNTIGGDMSEVNDEDD